MNIAAVPLSKWFCILLIAYIAVSHLEFGRSGFDSIGMAIISGVSISKWGIELCRE